MYALTRVYGHTYDTDTCMHSHVCMDTHTTQTHVCTHTCTCTRVRVRLLHLWYGHTYDTDTGSSCDLLVDLTLTFHCHCVNRAVFYNGPRTSTEPPSCPPAEPDIDIAAASAALDRSLGDVELAASAVTLHPDLSVILEQSQLMDSVPILFTEDDQLDGEYQSITTEHVTASHRSSSKTVNVLGDMSSYRQAGDYSDMFIICLRITDLCQI